MKAPANNWLFIARVNVTESRARRLRMSHLPHQVAFSWSLLNMAASARRRYMAEKTATKPVQADLFGGCHG